MSPKTKEQNEEIRRQTRQQILDAAFELFANNGFSKTSIAAVAKKAGISKGLIYHYFDSKEAILEGIFNQLIELSEEVLNVDDDVSPKEKMKQVLEHTFQFIKEDIGTARLMISLALQPDTFSSLKGKIMDAQQEQMKQYIKLFEELGYEQPEMEAYEVGAIMDGILMGCISMGDQYPFQEMKTKLMEKYVLS
ncbi:MAG: TetR/AcrR family transcriptional regulator [Balneolaceae bacterium]